MLFRILSPSICVKMHILLLFWSGLYFNSTFDIQYSKFNILHSPLSNPQSPILNLQSPLSNLHSSISTLQSPISNLQSPILTLQSPILNLQSSLSNRISFSTDRDPANSCPVHHSRVRIRLQTCLQWTCRYSLSVVLF